MESVNNKQLYVLEILSGLTIAMTLVPEALSFAFMAHTPPAYGLYAAVIVIFITSVFGGRIGMVSSAAGSTAVILGGIVTQYNIEYMLLAVALSGLIQIFIGAARMARFISLMPYSVFLGFVNGLAIIIFLSQIHMFKDKATDTWLSFDEIMAMLIMVVANIVMFVTIPKMIPKIVRFVPAPLIAILASYAFCQAFGLDARTIKDLAHITDVLPSFHVPDVPWTWDTMSIVIPASFVIAGTGVIESLLTLRLIDQMTQTRGKSNQESIALGFANLISGFFTSIGGCALVGQSLINVNNGVKTRLPGAVVALAIVLTILFGSSIIENIPLGSLVGLLFYIAFKTFAWNTFRIINKVPHEDLIIVIIVTIATVMFNLATAVVTGVIIAALTYAWQMSSTISTREVIDENGSKTYKLQGPLFFGSVDSFMDLFDIPNDPDHVIIDFKRSKVCDHSAIKAIDDIAILYKEYNKSLHLKHLSPECKQLLNNAKDLVILNEISDPDYHILSN